MYSENDWRSYSEARSGFMLAHSWGKKPEQKAREKEYNHDYYERNKELILARRKKHGDKDHTSKAIKDEDDSDQRAKDNQTEVEELIRINAEIGGYPPEVMENIKKHNQNVIDNINAITKHVNDYLRANAGKLSSDEITKIRANLQSQVDKQRDMMLDLRKESTRGYLEDLGYKSSGGRKSSSKSSRSNSKSAAKTEEKPAASSSSSSGSNTAKNKTSGGAGEKDWYKNGDERREEYRRQVELDNSAAREEKLDRSSSAKKQLSEEEKKRKARGY